MTSVEELRHFLSSLSLSLSKLKKLRHFLFSTKQAKVSEKTKIIDKQVLNAAGFVSCFHGAFVTFVMRQSIEESFYYSLSSA